METRDAKTFRILIILPALLVAGVLWGCVAKVKEPAVAGSFYPSDEKVLAQTVDGFLAAAGDVGKGGKLIALISPHAGYQFSGQVAAYTYRHLMERDIRTVILIGPSHHKSFNGASVYAKGGMKTPLGIIPINERVAGSLIDADAGVVFDEEAFEKEHSLEVQLPFLQRSLKSFTIVPILIGSSTKKSFDHLTNKLTRILAQDGQTIIIASSDLSHYHPYDAAVAMDDKTIRAVGRMSVEEIRSYLASGEGEMCGGNPVLYTMAIARALGATNGILFKYANSGDVTGEKEKVVGYAAIGIYKSPLTNEEKDLLLSLAKKTIAGYVSSGILPKTEIDNPRLAANGATFVTINRNGSLRGCIGNIQPVMPLFKSVISNAISASSRDHRFTPMTQSELDDMEVEVSVLSPLEPLRDIKEIEIGKHGLYLVKGPNTAVFLPQVPKEFGWDLETYLGNLSVKAGLKKDAWKESELYTFTADVIK